MRQNLQNTDTQQNNTLFARIRAFIQQNVTHFKHGAVALVLFLGVAFFLTSNGDLKQKALGTALAPVQEQADQPKAQPQKVAAAKPVVIESKVETKKLAAEPQVERVVATGEASYYGPGFEGRKTANGERFDSSEMTAAHRTLPFGSKIRVTNERNGKSVILRVNDRGPYAKDRVLDVSQGAAKQLGMIASGHADVKIELLKKS